MPGTRSELRSEPVAVPARRRLRKWHLFLIAVAALIAAGFGLWGRLPDPRSFLSALTGTDYAWVAAAIVLQVLSLGAFGWQQKLLMKALGVRMKVRHALLITLARTAISISLPAGAAVSAGYAVREYQKKAGASKEISAASMIVSGLASIGGLAALYVTGSLAVFSQDPSSLFQPQPLIIVGVMVVAVVTVVVVGRRLDKPSSGRGPRGDGRIVRYVHSLLRSARDGWRAGASLRARDWAASIVLLGLNWLFDLLCLTATCRAVGLPVGVTTLAGIYLGVQIVRQVPLTPGGVGVIDTALVAGLTAAGATAATAAAAVLLYRLISCWAIIPIGGVAAIVLRRVPAPREEPAPAV